MTGRYGLKSIKGRFKSQYGTGYYQRRRNKGFRSEGFRSYQRNISGANAKATRALQLIRKFKNEEEKKDITTAVSLSRATATTPGVFTSLNIMAQGNTKITRIGNKVTMEGLALRMNLTLNTAETGPVLTRVMVLLDRRPGGAVFTGADVLQNDTTNGLYNIDEDKSGRFQVLYDRNMTMATGGTECRFLKLYIPMKGRKASYNGNVGDITDLQKNHLAIGLWATNNSHTVQCNGFARLRFTDA